MRVSGGEARGIPLLVPPGNDVRPSTDGLRQAVFSSLAGRVAGCRFLDLFAGSGAFGLEALSRGAAGGIFVERNRRAAECLRRNLAAVEKSLGRRLDAVLLEADVFTLGEQDVPAADLIFADPPFSEFPGIGGKILHWIASRRLARPDGVVVLKLPGRVDLSPPGWKCLKRLGSDPAAAFFKAGG